MSVILTVDNREKALFSEIEQYNLEPNVFKNTMPITVEYATIPIGDYLISIDGAILAVIERKTLKDYAASIVDGRQSNVEKLLALRETTSCQIYYLVEGSPNPALTSQHNHMEYKSILASIRRLQISHNIHLIDSKNKQTTVRELFFLCEIYSGLVADGKIEAVKIEGAMEKSMPSKEDILYKNVILSWQVFPGVGRKTALLLANEHKLADLFTGELKKPGSKEIVWTEELKVKFFSSLPLFSTKTAKEVIGEISPEDFVVDLLAECKVISTLNCKKLRDASIQRIKAHLTFSRKV